MATSGESHAKLQTQRRTRRDSKHHRVGCATSGRFLHHDVDAHYQQAIAAGATQLQPPTEMFWGDRMYKVADSDGHYWAFAQNVADFDLSKVPGWEPT